VTKPSFAQTTTQTERYTPTVRKEFLLDASQFFYKTSSMFPRLGRQMKKNDEARRPFIGCELIQASSSLRSHSH